MYGREFYLDVDEIQKDEEPEEYAKDDPNLDFTQVEANDWWVSKFGSEGFCQITRDVQGFTKWATTEYPTWM